MNELVQNDDGSIISGTDTQVNDKLNLNIDAQKKHQFFIQINAYIKG
jgi:hypothetical protein